MTTAAHSFTLRHIVSRLRRDLIRPRAANPRHLRHP
jgi:hypothetical protein